MTSVCKQKTIWFLRAMKVPLRRAPLRPVDSVPPHPLEAKSQMQVPSLSRERFLAHWKIVKYAMSREGKYKRAFENHLRDNKELFKRCKNAFVSYLAAPCWLFFPPRKCFVFTVNCSRHGDSYWFCDWWYLHYSCLIQRNAWFVQGISENWIFQLLSSSYYWKAKWSEHSSHISGSPVSVWYGYEGKTGEERNLVPLKDMPTNNLIKRSRWELSLNTLTKLIFENKEITLLPILLL